MKFGTRVIVTRGGSPGPSHVPSYTPGTTTDRREVPGVLIGARGKQVLVRLDYYDSPYDDECRKAFGIWFSRSAVRKEEE